MARARPKPHAESQGRGGRRKALVESDEQVRDWYNERALRSRLSADTYVRQLSLVSDRLGRSPDRIVALARSDPDELRRALTKTAAQLIEEGRLSSYVSKWFDSLKSYLKFRRVNADVFPKLRATAGESLVTEVIPNPEQLGQVLERLSLRGRAIALLMAHSGLRPGAIGSYGGEGGLRLRDLPELRISRRLDFGEVPFVIRVPGTLSKTKVAYTTFGSAQLAATLAAYLESRREGGEELGPDSPLVSAFESRGVARSSRQSARFGRGFLVTKTVVEELRNALQSTVPAGKRWRPYVLRAYCSTRLMLAEGAGKITRDLREAILGHDGGVAARYNVGKTWGEDLLREARAAYKRSEPYLVTGPERGRGLESEERFKRLLLRVAGYSDGELAKLDWGRISDEEIEKLVAERTSGRSASPSQQVVPVERVESLLAHGWEYVAPLAADRVVLRAPNGTFGRPAAQSLLS